jgi:class 3 adenylate cyclase
MQLERLPDGISASDHGELELRGFPGTVSVLELSGRPTGNGAVNDTGELWTRSPFL